MSAANPRTPGPWSIESMTARHVNTNAIVISADDGLGPVAYSTTANAKLICAAPELLAALQDLLKVASVRIDDPRIAQWDAARAAIDKATGAAS